MVARTRLLATHTKLATRFTLAAFFASAVFFLFARESDACSMLPPPSELELLQESSRVYAGKIAAAYPERGGEIYEFKVERVWKGPLHETSFLYWPVSPARVAAKGTSCERVVQESPLSVGSRHLVFVRGGLAGDVRNRYRAIEIMAEMGEGQVPVPGSSAPLTPEIRRAMAAKEFTVRSQIVVGVVALLSVAIIVGVGLLNSGASGRRSARAAEILRRMTRRRPLGDRLNRGLYGAVSEGPTDVETVD